MKKEEVDVNDMDIEDLIDYCPTPNLNRFNDPSEGDISASTPVPAPEDYAFGDIESNLSIEEELLYSKSQLLYQNLEMMRSTGETFFSMLNSPSGIDVAKSFLQEMKIAQSLYEKRLQTDELLGKFIVELFQRNNAIDKT